MRGVVAQWYHRADKSATATRDPAPSSTRLWIRFPQAVRSAPCCLSILSVNTAASTQKASSHLFTGNIPPQRDKMREKDDKKQGVDEND